MRRFDWMFVGMMAVSMASAPIMAGCGKDKDKKSDDDDDKKSSKKKNKKVDVEAICIKMMDLVGKKKGEKPPQKEIDKCVEKGEKERDKNPELFACNAECFADIETVEEIEKCDKKCKAKDKKDKKDE